MLDTFNSVLTNSLGPFGPLIAVGILGVVLILLTLPALLKRQKDPLDKLKESTRAQASAKSQKALRTNSKNAKLEKYSTFLEPQDEKEYSAIKLKLLQAGYRGRDAVRTYYFLQFTLGIGGLVLGLLLVMLKMSTSEPSTTNIIMTMMMPGIVGYMGPKYWVGRRQKERQQEITNGFPDALDMMLVCVEAGQSLDQSIIRVSKEIRAGFPALADEFETVSNELKAGKDKTQVLRDMGERAGVTDVSSFVTVMIQSAAFGTSIAEALRVYAAEMRDKRVMRAEEKANTLPTKLTLATMMLTVPPLLIILIGPSIYEIIQTLGSTFGG